MRQKDSILLFLTAVLAGFIVTETIAILGQVIGHGFVIGGRPRYYIVIGYVCALVTGFVFSGYLTSHIFQPAGRTRNELIAISAGAGFVIWWIWVFFYSIIGITDLFQSRFYMCAFLLISLIMAFIVSFLSSIGAVLYVFSSPAPGTGQPGTGAEMQHPARPKVRGRHFLLVIVLCLFLPTGLSCIGIASGMIDCDACMCDPWLAYC
ncbi:MAG: hypothetical protein JW736_07695, partial [Deltaproteobacteria bacterium]|nr:hypothetical protein [Deltaproteobacteria bacterium]